MIIISASKLFVVLVKNLAAYICIFLLERLEFPLDLIPRFVHEGSNKRKIASVFLKVFL